MAAATLDLDINEGDTFIMALDFWSDVDNTIPIDVTTSTFTGSFRFGNTLVPMVVTQSTYAVNVIEAKVAYTAMVDLPTQGRYDIDQLTDGDKFRLIQGNVRVSQEVTV